MPELGAIAFILMWAAAAAWAWARYARGHVERKDLAPIRHLGPTPERPWVALVGEYAGLALEPVDGGPDAAGEAHGWPIRLVERENWGEVHLICDTLGAVPRPFRVGREGILQSADLRTGDAAFDRLIRLAGPDRVVAALVSRETRPLMFRMAKKGGLDVKDGVVTLVLGRSSAGPDRLG